MAEVKELSKMHRQEPDKWEIGQKCNALLNDTKDLGVQRVFGGEILGRRGNRVFIVGLPSGDVHHVHETRLFLPEAADLMLPSDAEEVDEPPLQLPG